MEEITNELDTVSEIVIIPWNSMSLETNNKSPRTSVRSLYSHTTSKIIKRDCKTAEESAPKCSICMQLMQEHEIARKFLKCGHEFHIHCLEEWLISKTTCPNCRFDWSSE